MNYTVHTYYGPAEEMAEAYFDPEHRPTALVPGPTMTFEATDPVAAAEAAFVALNRDDRPNRTDQRSLSVGDVVVVHRADEPDVWLMVMPTGFASIAPQQEV